MADVTFIQMPLWRLLAMVIVPLVVLAAGVALLRRLARARSIGKDDPDWSVPQLEGRAGNSPLHRWDVRCKIVTILVYSFMITAIQQMTTAFVAIGLSCLVMVVARVSLVKVLMRLLAIVGFITMFLLVMPFTVPLKGGDTVIVFGGLEWLHFSLRGFRLAATIAAKAVAITLLMEPLLATAPLPVTLQGLSRLGVPEMAGQMVLLSYRYLNVFRHEARRMSTGMQGARFPQTHRPGHRPGHGQFPGHVVRTQLRAYRTGVRRHARARLQRAFPAAGQTAPAHCGSRGRRPVVDRRCGPAPLRSAGLMNA